MISTTKGLNSQDSPRLEHAIRHAPPAAEPTKDSSPTSRPTQRHMSRDPVSYDAMAASAQPSNGNEPAQQETTPTANVFPDRDSARSPPSPIQTRATASTSVSADSETYPTAHTPKRRHLERVNEVLVAPHNLRPPSDAASRRSLCQRHRHFHLYLYLYENTRPLAPALSFGRKRAWGSAWREGNSGEGGSRRV